MQAGWMVTMGALAVAAIAALGDLRRVRRRDPDRVGWVPWPLVLVLSVSVAAIAAAVALGR